MTDRADLRRNRWRQASERVRARSPFCHYCGALATETDHLVPPSRGGTDDPSNLVPACRSCNASKGGRTLEEWRRSRPPVRRTPYSDRHPAWRPLRGDYSRRP